MLLQQVLNGLSIGSVYAIFAIGYSLVFSLLGVINFSHGAIFTVGAYASFTLLTGSFGNGYFGALKLPFVLPMFFAILGGALTSATLSMLVELCAFRPLRKRKAEPTLSLISSLGVALAVVSFIQLVYGSETQSLPADIFESLPPVLEFGGALVRTSQALIFCVSIIAMAFLFAGLHFTRFGKALRAVAENPATASLLGISVNRYIFTTFLISGFLAGLAGILVASSYGISGPYFGVTYGLKGLAVVILGGLGTLGGGFVGGFVVGIAEAFVPAELSAYKEAVAFSFLFLFLLLRPQGILGKSLIQKV
jgi:branched-chain amino acid transport system permease protein